VLLGVSLIRRLVDAVQLERDDLHMHVVLLSVRRDVATVGTAEAASMSPG
jgi:hypothetical protein